METPIPAALVLSFMYPEEPCMPSATATVEVRCSRLAAICARRGSTSFFMNAPALPRSVATCSIAALMTERYAAYRRMYPALRNVHA